MLSKRSKSLSAVFMCSLVALVSLVACSSRDVQKSQTDLEGLAFDPAANNVALIFGSDGGNLDGVETDLRELEKLFNNPEMNLHFRVSVNREVSSTEMQTIVARESAAIGERGTMLFYYSGHGAEGSGCMAFPDSCITFKPIAEAIKKGRATPMKRLFFFADSCFSGNLVDGSNKIIGEGSALTYLNGADDPNSDTTGWGKERLSAKAMADDVFNVLNTTALTTTGPHTYDGFQGSIFEQGFAMSAARASEESEDLGKEGGGAFTLAFRKTFADLRKTSPQATIGDLAQKSTDLTSKDHGHTPVYRGYPSNVVLGDKLFEGGGDVVNNNNNITQPQAIAAALAAPYNTAGASVLLASGEARIATMALCFGRLATCSATPAKNVLLRRSPTNTIDNRPIFYSGAPLGLVSESLFTIVGFDATDRPVALRTIATMP